MEFTINRINQLSSIENQSIIISEGTVYIKNTINDYHILSPINDIEKDIIKDSNKVNFIEKLKNFFEGKNFEIIPDTVYKLKFIKNYDVEDKFDNLQLGDIIYMSVINEWFLINELNHNYILICLGGIYKDMTFDTMDELKRQMQKGISILGLKYYAKNNTELIIDLFN